ncbi:MAG: response regulator transcription factor [Phycisphaerae bacterium]
MPERRKPSRQIEILVVDDHPIMRAGLIQLIAQEGDLAICGEAEDARGALAAIEAHPPDLAVVDISLKESSGLDLIKDIRARWPKLPVLVLSMHDEAIYAERVLRAGARGYVTKSEVSCKVIEGIRKVLAGEVYVSEQLASKMITSLVGGGDLDTFPIDRLTDRELQVLDLIGRGLQTREVADRLHLSTKTVDAHREHIKKKLNLDSAAELVRYAVHWVQFEQGA